MARNSSCVLVVDRGLKRQIVSANSATERPAGHGLGFVGDVDWAHAFNSMDMMTRLSKFTFAETEFAETRVTPNL